MEGNARMIEAPLRQPSRVSLSMLALSALIVLLGACGEAHVVRREPGYDVPQHATPASRHAGVGEVEVIRGDTLYGLAFRNAMDFRELAAINRIEAPYTIYVGQILKLRGARASTPIKPVVQTPPHSVRVMPLPSTVPGTRPVRVVPEPAASTPGDSAPLATVPRSVPTPFVPVPSAAIPTDTAPTISVSPDPVPAVMEPAPVPSAAMPRLSATPAPIQPAAVVMHTPSTAILPVVVGPVGAVGWHWPAKGALLGRFMAGDATRQGIDIGGADGDPVFAASDGVVVYSGSGLVGYGELIIIKHSDEWLSAYGHNRKRLVQEGQRVKAGQPIAEMGRTGAPRDEVHFEIRRNGRPVDPLQYLPAH